MGLMGVLLVLVGGVLAVVLAVVLMIYVVVPVLKAIGWAVMHILRFIGGEISDVLRFIGAILAGLVYIPLVIGSVIIGRWSAAAHFGRGVQNEIKAGFACLYRVFVGHPARLLCLHSLTEGLEKRVPEMMAAAPGRDKPGGRSGQFDGYTIIGSLSGGGSGGRLYVAEPDPVKLASLDRSGHANVDQVVIKTFSLHDGSSLPQIVRESRALDAAKKMGLVLEHELTDERFFYVMRYVPGESLGLVTQRLHAESGADGLEKRELIDAMGFAADIIRTLDAYHKGGLWHKDVKPDNIIVDGKRAHLVDLGLITPLRSAMTLTTHGTEYFRDPELVRLALKGVKVHQVDGAKFDIYAAGAVLYSIIENSFPAHGGLSQVTKKCPEALKWVIRRSMTDYDKRYASMTEMLADLHVIMTADDPFAVRMGSLPSMSGETIELEEPEPVFVQAAHTPRPRQEPRPEPRREQPRQEAPPAERVRPSLRVSDWWTGRYVVDAKPDPHTPSPPPPSSRAAAQAAAGSAPRYAPRAKAHAGHPLGLTAREQVQRARGRAESARRRAQERMHGRQARRAGKPYSNEVNPGGAIALFLFLAACVGLTAVLISAGTRGGSKAVTISTGGADGVEISVKEDAPRMLPALEGSILVVRDGELNADSEAEVREFLADLEESGADVRGAFAGLKEADADYAEVTTLMAKAELVRDLAPIGSADANDRLASWITNEDVADVLLWIHTGEDLDPADPEIWAVQKKISPESHLEFKRIAFIMDAISRF